MKKIFVFIIALFMLFNNAVFAYGDINSEHDSEVFNLFKNTSIEKDSGFSAKVTRRDAVIMALNFVMNGDCGEVIAQQWIDSVLPKVTFSDTDISNITDFRIAAAGYYFDLLKGKIDANGVVYAALDDTITYKEAHIICGRALIFVADNLEFEDYLFSDWSLDAYKLGFFDNLSGDSVRANMPNVEKTENKELSVEEFYNIMYKALFIPYEDHTYGGSNIYCRYYELVS